MPLDSGNRARNSLRGRNPGNLGLLSHGDLTVCSVAGSSLGPVREKAAVPDLLQALDRDLVAPVKGVIARRIGALGSEADIVPLREFYLKSADSGYRHDLSAAMAKLGDPNDHRQLIEQLSQPIPACACRRYAISTISATAPSSRASTNRYSTSVTFSPFHCCMYRLWCGRESAMSPSSPWPIWRPLFVRGLHLAAFYRTGGGGSAANCRSLQNYLKRRGARKNG